MNVTEEDTEKAAAAEVAGPGVDTWQAAIFKVSSFLQAPSCCLKLRRMLS